MTKKRILVVGSPGAGKTTFSRALAEILNLPLVHLDSYYWQKNWKASSKKTFKNKVKLIANKDEWIIDGNYLKTLDIRLKRAQMVIFLDYSKFLCVKSILKRIRMYEGIQREDLKEGCIEVYDRSFLKWAFVFPEKYKPQLFKKIKKYQNVELVVFKTRADALSFLENLSKN